MKRSELYKLVWQKPRSHLGPELGLSDVGLSKLCRRYEIPVPPAGYWAHRTTGNSNEPTPLPPTEIDHEIRLPEQDKGIARSYEAKRVQQIRQKFARSRDAIALRPIEIPASLDHCHALVAKTAHFFQSIERENTKRANEAEKARQQHRPFFGGITNRKKSFGRYISGNGCLRITATLTNIDWILRFHEALIRGLIAGGCQLVPGEEDSSNVVEIRRAGGVIKLNFAEQVEKIVQPRHKEVIFQPNEYKATGAYKLKLERDWGSIARQWTGSREQMAQQLPEITRAMIAFPEAEGLRSKLVAEAAAEQRRLRQEAARAHNIALAAEQALAQRSEARANQLPRAVAVAQSLTNYYRVLEVLSHLERLATDQPQDEALHAWIALLRSNLKDPVQELADALHAEAAQLNKPLWWPE
ncbi:hypothetical protein [Delftia acidovorans]|uniref:hypothetical protein n=1 Tax=Delftia acidovorans TaxID=80866 RepID=UPI000BD5C061|nr:hypothetical protein [Delftia acidovorans]SOE35319.1 hypothetical protein SAMN05216519_1299 [Delftia acidovorans]